MAIFKQAKCWRLGIFLAAGLPLAAISPARAGADEAALLEAGKALVRENCSRCHAIGLDDKSPHDQAPPFRVVMKRYPAENITEALAEGIVSGHSDMPEFSFEPDQIDAIVSYLNSLRGDSPE